MEIGSFIELDLRNTGEFYAENNVVRLNAARAGIFHACKLFNVRKIYIPYYQCPTVSAFLQKQDIEILYYNIDSEFRPLINTNEIDTAFLLVNYFGILSSEYINSIADNFKNVIVDNSPAFYSKPTFNCISVYSPRKFFGVPDGCYVIGDKTINNQIKYPQDFSSDSAAFLFKRIEKGCNAVYAERMKNEERIDNSDIMQMSELTKALLRNIDYNSIAETRKKNFQYTHDLYKSINLINPIQFQDTDCVPMVYPLVIENSEIVKHLTENKIYTGRWWNSVLRMVNSDSVEAYLSKYMIPLPIDQRYSETEIQYIAQLIFNFILK
jgi:hypothetical protein